jgi:hypothetical protein
MKYIVKRSSLYNNEKPCNEAFLCAHKCWDIRYYGSEETFDFHHSNTEGTWRGKGKNHTKIGNTCIKRQIDKELWTVEISSIRELNKFIAKYGKIIIRPWEWISYPEIEIYDDYIE